MKYTALITGATSGIGYELAQLCAKDGHDLILVSRNAAKMEGVAADFKKQFGTHTTIIAQDLSKPNAAEAVFKQTQEAGIQVDVLINNAGFGLFGEFVSTDLKKEQEMIQLNITALVDLSKLYAAEMKKRGVGRILNVASIAAFQPGPLMAVYYATKAFVLSFSEAINEELRGSGVTVTALCPGLTETGFVKEAKLEGSRLSTTRTMPAQRVAELGYAAMMNGKRLIITGRRNAFLAWMIRFTPRAVALKVIAHVQKQQG